MNSHSWLPDELSLAGRENLDEQHVARYDGKMDADPKAEVELLRSVGMTKQSRLLEFGPGTGQFILHAAPHVRSVTAVDVSPPMLRLLAQKTADLDNVQIVQAGFLGYDGPAASFDIIYSRFALHHLPDMWKAFALQRMRQLLRPGGFVRLWDVVYDFPLAEAQDRLEAWCATGGEEVHGEWSRHELEEHVRDEHSTFTWLLKPMIHQAGFAIEHVEHVSDGFESKYVLRALATAP